MNADTSHLPQTMLSLHPNPKQIEDRRVRVWHVLRHLRDQRQ